MKTCIWLRLKRRLCCNSSRIWTYYDKSGKRRFENGQWVYKTFESIYKPIEEKGGGAYFYTNQGWIKNDNYKDLPDLRVEAPLKSMPQDPIVSKEIEKGEVAKRQTRSVQSAIEVTL